MAYVTVAVVAALIVVGLVMLAALLLRLLGARRHVLAAARPAQAMFAERIGLLTARAAALRVELARRRAGSAPDGAAGTSTQPPRSVG